MVRMGKQRVLITVPQPLRGLLLTEAALLKLGALAEVTMNEEGRNWSGEEIAARLPGVDALITGWGIVKLTPEVLAGADRLRLIAHSAGSVKGFVTEEVFRRGIQVTHAAPRIADAVAEYTLTAVLLGLRRLHEFDRQMKAGALWPKTREEPLFEIAGRKVGLLGMGYVGQRVARLLRAVGAVVWAYDPYLAPERAEALGVGLAALDDLLRNCPVVSVHLPVTEETHHLLGARELALLPNGAVFINSARSWTVDQQALLAELSSGRIWAALDVFDAEPLPLDHPFRRLDNVLLTPHTAGVNRDAYRDLISLMVDEVERFFSGQPLRYAVTQEMMARMA
jgi:phosphoglycerate dehydrogenase-like enzyme